MCFSHLQDARLNHYTKSSTSSMSSGSESNVLNPPAVGQADSQDSLGTTTNNQSLLLQQSQQSQIPSHMSTLNPPGGEFRDSFFLPPQPPSLLSSRLVFGASASLAPPPNLRGDLRRLQGLEYTEADMSLSALYMHEKFHRMNTSSSSSMHRRVLASRYEFEQQAQAVGPLQRRASLNELDEENLPLLDVDGGNSGDRLSSSNMA